MAEDTESEEFEDYVRLNIIIPRDVLAILDHMKSYAGFGSRGRTIQALIEKIWGAKAQVRGTLTHFNIVRQKPNAQVSDYFPMLIDLIDIMNVVRTFVNVDVKVDDSPRPS